MQEKGKISITAENILPIIKKWLYSEHDIFIRELVSNAADAVTKHRHLSLTGQASQKDVDYRIEVAISESARTIHIKDNGIGMSLDEVKKYIADIAFSGAAEFMEKYQAADESQQIIGHFGLGFYSSFMVADRVEIKSQSYRTDEKSVHWICDGSTEYTAEELEPLNSQGTEIILHINEDSLIFLQEAELKKALKRHSEFLPLPIMLNGTRINEMRAIWNEQPSNLLPENYENLYQHLFPFSEKPLFHIHFNIDTPFQVRGILYFQRIKREFESYKGRIKLFCNRVFVSDSIEDLFPSYLFMLQGIIDCPDIPLNVSRSSLQGDPRIKKIGGLITKKIADRLKELFNTEREQYESFWEDINPFVKFGILQDDKFAERMNNFIIFKSTADQKYCTIADYLERNKEKHEKVYYVSNVDEQYSFVELFKSQGLEALIMDSMLDSHYIQQQEMKTNGVKFSRIDAELDEKLLDKNAGSKILDADNRTQEDNIISVFTRALANDKIKIKVEALKSPDVSGMVLLSEQMRRFRDMAALSMHKMPEFMDEHTFVVNSGNPLIKRILDMDSGLRSTDAALLCQHLYDLALMSHKQFEGKKMAEFVERSNKILGMLSA